MNIIKIDQNNPDKKHLQRAADVILKGGIIAYPTETVYGLGANAFNKNAVGKIFELKSRTKSQAILIIVAELSWVKELVTEFSATASQLAARFWPGPLTMIFKAAPHLPEILLGEGDSIGIRIPNNKICLELLRLCRIPLTSTSANVTGGMNPVSAEEVVSNLGDQLDLIIDGGILHSRTPSTVLDLTTEKPMIKRKGVITQEEIEQTIGFKLP